ncbi:MAG: hypothetical protein JEZ00_14210 [Anaerolineaceae bacterium]|nr:hypothetical protein [Anaerolineaceae bacterium]
MKTNHDEYLKYSTIFVTAIGVLILYAGIWSLDTDRMADALLVSSMRPALWIACILFFMGVIISNVLSRKSLTFASWALCISVTLGIFIFLLSLPTPFAILAFLFPVFLAAFILNWKHVLALIGMVFGLSIYLNFFRTIPHETELEKWLPIFILLFVATFLVIITSQLYANLQWFEQNYVSVHKSEQIIRDNEAELKRLLSHMKEYQKYLRETNVLLIKTSDEAERARQVKQFFVQNVSHELRTPLNLIIGFSETMINAPENYGEVKWTEELNGDIECIYQNSQHLKDLIDDVLDLATLESQKYEITPQDIDIHSVIREVILINEDSYRAKGLILESDLADQALMVYADPVRTKQIIINLLSNALKYTSSGGVVVTSQVVEQMAFISVVDTGKGIPQEDLDKVFEVFYQVDKSNNREDSGTGLGLSISKQLVELHGGEINVTSTFGEGTMVRFSLPLSSKV